MSRDTDLIADLLMGFLPDARAAEVEARLEDEPILAAEYDALREVLGALPLDLDPVGPPPALRRRILDAAEGGAERYAPMLERLGELFDVATATAREYAGRLFTNDGWEDLLPGIAYLDLEGGPAAAGGRVGLVRMTPGARFPLHRHVGPERTLILQGALRDSSGVELHAGDHAEGDDGVEHWFEAIGDEELVYAVVVENVVILGPAPMD